MWLLTVDEKFILSEFSIRWEIYEWTSLCSQVSNCVPGLNSILGWSGNGKGTRASYDSDDQETGDMKSGALCIIRDELKIKPPKPRRRAHVYLNKSVKRDFNGQRKEEKWRMPRDPWLTDVTARVTASTLILGNLKPQRGKKKRNRIEEYVLCRNKNKESYISPGSNNPPPLG